MTAAMSAPLVINILMISEQASLLTLQLVSVASGASHVHFDHQLQVLKDLIVYWKSNQEVTLVEVDKGIYMYTLFLS